MAAIAGDTIRLWVEFRDWSDALADPDEVTLTIRNRHLRELHAPVITGQHRVSPGRYEYDYMVPVFGGTDTEIEYEWTGTVGGLPEVARGRVGVRRAAGV